MKYFYTMMGIRKGRYYAVQKNDAMDRSMCFDGDHSLLYLYPYGKLTNG
jgi:hypothetical protein